MTINNASVPTGQPLPEQSSPLQLHDIHVPEQVSNLPIAPGWWLLLALIVIAVLWSYKKRKQNRQLNASKQQALAVLANNQTMSAKACLNLLKWAAMQYFSRQQLAQLYGDNFQTFLMQQLPEKYQVKFTQLSTAAFQQQYQAEQGTNTDIDSDCQQATKLWLTHALPVNKALSSAKVLPVEKSSALNKLVPVDKPFTVNKPVPTEKTSTYNKPVLAEKSSALNKEEEISQ
ncbi:MULTISPECIES: DUF4381 domain-containing protein [Colwellia]|uniref:DUF4381 domain-containing protein n=1 Tax=Colwellia marinimaniae TaxID=1513592 RepID=A0ABQ0MYI9_9GAMM|nr:MULTISPECIES: DUF4381 domain-containing protein [Colwellia]GAW97349.1 hypothetical protein MTCD1_02976 [Colwellia marinimaniae]